MSNVTMNATSESSTIAPPASSQKRKYTKEPTVNNTVLTGTVSTNADPPLAQRQGLSNKPLAKLHNNMFDAVMDEISDLLSAAEEAQALGRLKITNGYLLLSYVRLLGLGQRFDRTVVHLNNGRPLPDTVYENLKSANKEEDSEHVRKGAPLEVDMDNSIMERLARAAIEFYCKRTGRKSRPTAAAAGVELVPPMGGKANSASNGNVDSLEQTDSQKPTVSEATKESKVQKKGGANKKRAKKDSDPDDEEEEADEEEDEDEEDDEDGAVPSQRGKRGKKPPRVAIQTLQNANFDARRIIMKWLLSKADEVPQPETSG